MTSFLERTTRYLFFTGKGGVGKTSLACATAIALADRGKRVLLVSTDPASNLDEVLGVQLTSKPVPIPGVGGLFAMNIDPEVAAREYRERMVGPYRGMLPEAAVASIEEQLSGACTVEIAAFDEFSKLLGAPAATADFDHVILDTAPTGHTLRLMELPAAWTDFLESNAGGTSCLGPLSGLQTQRTLYAATVQALSDPSITTLVLVSRPERAALNEAERTRGELSELGIRNQRLALNGVFRSNGSDDPTARALAARGRAALEDMPPGLVALPRTEVPLLPFGLVGIEALRALLNSGHMPGRIAPLRPSGTPGEAPPLPPSLASWIPQLAVRGHGVVMTMGKGGVGKTTIASAIAVELARRGHRVHLSTTDPAAHLDVSLANVVDGLDVGRIDPKAETRDYRAEVLATAGKHLDAAARNLLEEELRSPCTEEIAVFRAFAREVEKGRDAFVVLDTAPTGHTLLLLDATEAYHRQVSQTMSDLPEAVRVLLPRLRDPEFTQVLLVTLPEATPVHEAAQLQKDLKRAQITPFAWVINQSLAPLMLTDPVLIAKQESEYTYIREIQKEHATRVAIVPWTEESQASTEWLGELLRHRNAADQVPSASPGLARR
jgi:arsenite-transporting ATPase